LQGKPPEAINIKYGLVWMLYWKISQAQAKEPRACLDAKFSPKFHYAKRRFPSH
jgi:hypothetical protein